MDQDDDDYGLGWSKDKDEDAISGGLSFADTGQWREFSEWLHGFWPDDDLANRLHEEALSLARSGDLKGAADRLRLFTEPKYYSTEQCQQKYNEAMGRS